MKRELTQMREDEEIKIIDAKGKIHTVRRETETVYCRGKIMIYFIYRYPRKRIKTYKLYGSKVVEKEGAEDEEN